MGLGRGIPTGLGGGNLAPKLTKEKFKKVVKKYLGYSLIELNEAVKKPDIHAADLLVIGTIKKMLSKKE